MRIPSQNVLGVWSYTSGTLEFRIYAPTLEFISLRKVHDLLATTLQLWERSITIVLVLRTLKAFPKKHKV